MNIKTITTSYLLFAIADIYFKICKKIVLKNTWGSFGHVKIYKKIEYFLIFEYAVLYKMIKLYQLLNFLLKSLKLKEFLNYFQFIFTSLFFFFLKKTYIQHHTVYCAGVIFVNFA
jgi:hypothetical protein